MVEPLKAATRLMDASTNAALEQQSLREDADQRAAAAERRERELQARYDDRLLALENTMMGRKGSDSSVEPAHQ